MGLCASSAGPALKAKVDPAHDEALHATRTASVVSLDLLLDNAECFKNFTSFMIESDNEHLIQFIMQLKTFKVHMLLHIADRGAESPNTMRYEKMTYSQIVSPIFSKVKYSEPQNKWAKTNAKKLFEKFVKPGAELDSE